MSERFTKLSMALRFLQVSMRNPLKIGAVLPSSKSLAKAMVKDLEIRPGEHILEFGPGTGSLTQAIYDILPAPSAYLGIEREEKFIFLLKQHFSDLFFMHGSAEDALHYCENHQFSNVKAIISGLPFASLPMEVQMHIIHSIEHILSEPKSVFRTFQYATAFAFPNAVNFRERMNQIFGPCHRSPILLANFPPAYVLTWTREAH